ncbi:ribonuclease E inhibitor RraB [Cognaticolwellia beringensis]|uniref:Ribonuclease E inhibitor RraB n=1 Tax=Cognaticolwellia beringensis TaxID=1967665 RepID=A0A222GBN4_9GAMM|nr:ribonuclease E inhibitor RraB [Cognaticolwellia beringensis]ASP49257.1 ribonuclease E inhibitor RraB [Cognaticolwellia beringensis]
MNFPKDDTGKVLFEMQKAGIDLTVMHTIVFFHLFETPEQAAAMAAYLAEIAPDLICHVHIDENPKIWHLDCSITIIPLYDAIIAQEAKFEQIVSQFKGYTDGWGIEA